MSYQLKPILYGDPRTREVDIKRSVLGDVARVLTAAVWPLK